MHGSRMDLLRPKLAALLLALPISVMAEAMMVPGIPYHVRGSDHEQARVIFHPDSRVLVREGEAPTLEHEGNWRRRDGQICITEDSEFGPLCMDEVAGQGGGFSLMFGNSSMDFAPMPQ